MPNEVEVRIYASPDGTNPTPSGRRGSGTGRLRLGHFGDSKRVGEVFELRIHVGPGYRVYYGREGDAVVILLCGGDKRSQTRDIERAEAYWRDYRSRDHGKD